MDEKEEERRREGGWVVLPYLFEELLFSEFVVLRAVDQPQHQQVGGWVGGWVVHRTCLKSSFSPSLLCCAQYINPSTSIVKPRKPTSFP